MDDNLHNENLEDFFRKSLQNFEDNPDDFAWDNIASFIQPVVNPEVSQLQKQVQQLNNQNLLLKILLTTIGISMVCLLLFNPQNQQQKITLLGQELTQQNKTITALNQKIDSFYIHNRVNQYKIQEEKLQHSPITVLNNSNSPPSVNPHINQEKISLHQASSAYKNSNASSLVNPYTNQKEKSQYYAASTFKNSNIPSSIKLHTNQEEKLPQIPTSTFKKINAQSNVNQYLIQEEKSQHHTIYAFNPTKLPALPYINTEHENLIITPLKEKDMSKWEKDFLKNKKRIQLPSFHLKPILEQLNATIYMGVGEVENHFRYDESFLGEELLGINGVFQEDSKHLEYGLLLAYNLNEQLQIQSGIGQSQYQQNIKNIHLEGIYTALNPNEELELKDQFYTSYSNNEIEYTLNNINQQFPDTQALDTLRVPIEVGQNINYLSIPLAAKYKFGKKRFSFFIKGGLSINFLINNELEISSPHSSFQKHKLIQSSGLEKIHLSYQLETGLQYQINKYIGLQIAPYYRASISQLTEDLPIIAYPAITGLQIGANLKF